MRNFRNLYRSTAVMSMHAHWPLPLPAKGRTNIELREQFILAEGVSQSMSAFKPKTPSQQRSVSISSGSAGPITKVTLQTCHHKYLLSWQARTLDYCHKSFIDFCLMCSWNVKNQLKFQHKSSKFIKLVGLVVKNKNYKTLLSMRKKR